MNETSMFVENVEKWLGTDQLKITVDGDEVVISDGIVSTTLCNCGDATYNYDCLADEGERKELVVCVNCNYIKLNLWRDE